MGDSLSVEWAALQKKKTPDEIEKTDEPNIIVETHWLQPREYDGDVEKGIPNVEESRIFKGNKRRGGSRDSGFDEPKRKRVSTTDSDSSGRRLNRRLEIVGNCLSAKRYCILTIISILCLIGHISENYLLFSSSSAAGVVAEKGGNMTKSRRTFLRFKNATREVMETAVRKYAGTLTQSLTDKFLKTLKFDDDTSDAAYVWGDKISIAEDDDVGVF